VHGEMQSQSPFALMWIFLLTGGGDPAKVT